MSFAVLSATVTWWLTTGTALADTPPTNNTPPTISGVAQQGDELIADPGTWSGDDPITFTYQWSDGQTGSTDTLAATDVGQPVSVTVTASNAFGDATATSDSVGPVAPAAPVEGAPPVLSGTPQQGDKLTVSNGSWSNDPTFSYVWDDCDSSGTVCAPIGGAASSSYTLQPSDVGSTIIVVVTASNDGGQASAASNGVGPVLPAPPANSIAPSITGTPQQGDTLSVSNGSWSNNPTFGYVWNDCTSSGSGCSPIAGATSSTYSLGPGDVGRFVNVTVTATNAGGQVSLTTSSLGPVLPPVPVNSIAPGSTGTAQQGATLTASTGSWSNNPTYAYVWSDCTSSGGGCSPIAGATSTTYKLASTDVGKYVSVTVTASNPGGHGSVTSATVGPVLPPAPVNTTAPAINGTPEQGDTITVASNGGWNNNPSAFTYAWEDCNSSGTTCSAIAGATSGSYTLSAADIGSAITCIVTAQGAGGNTSARSNTTGVVIAAPTPAASQPTTTALLVSPANLVTNQGVTLIATVTSGASSSTALWGAVTFENAGDTISGCGSLPVKPSGQSATVACSTSFAASTAQLTAVFTPTSGSVLQSSVSPTDNITIGPDSTSTSLDASSSVDVGASTTYTASVAPPAARLGPIQPTGSIEFLDGAQPINSCANQALNGGVAKCTVTYAAAGGHAISARYVGDANFSASSSPTDAVNAVLDPPPLMGRMASTMQWGFYYTPSYTQIRSLVVNGVSAGTTVRVNCHGRSCPFVRRAALLTNRLLCGTKPGMCFTGGSFLITPGFGAKRLKTGTRITVEIVRPNWVGRYYSFTVRSRRAPRIQISCLAPGGSVPGQGC